MLVSEANLLRYYITPLAFPALIILCLKISVSGVNKGNGASGVNKGNGASGASGVNKGNGASGASGVNKGNGAIAELNQTKKKNKTKTSSSGWLVGGVGQSPTQPTHQQQRSQEPQKQQQQKRQAQQV
jgi:hypothetical protein